MFVLKTRLNMLPVFANFKGDVTMEKICVHFKMEEDNTEHLVECRQLGETILKKEDIADDGNPELWKLMNKRIKYNLNTGGSKKRDEKLEHEKKSVRMRDTI